MVQGTIKITQNFNPPCWTFMTECTLPNFNLKVESHFFHRNSVEKNDFDLFYFKGSSQPLQNCKINEQRIVESKRKITKMVVITSLVFLMGNILNLSPSMHGKFTV